VDTDVEELVREGIDRLTAGARVPAGLAGRALRNRRRRRIAVGGGLAASTTAVVAAAVVLAASLAAPGTRNAATSVRGMQTTAYVVSHIERALAGADNRILFISGHSDPVTGEVWAYRGVTKSETGVNGKLAYADLSRITGGTSHRLYVDYRARAWWRITSAYQPRATARSACVLGPAGYVFVGNSISIALPHPPGEPDPASPAWVPFVRASLECGGFAVAGHQTVKGTQLIKIVGTAKDPYTRYMPQVMLVNPATFLPVRVFSPSGYSDISWLAPTKANLALLDLAVPHGFKHVSPGR
jgi:hypothetical protein